MSIVVDLGGMRDWLCDTLWIIGSAIAPLLLSPPHPLSALLSLGRERWFLPPPPFISLLLLLLLAISCGGHGGRGGKVEGRGLALKPGKIPTMTNASKGAIFDLEKTGKEGGE